MDKIIVTTPEELRSLITDAVKICMKPMAKPKLIADNLTIDEAIVFLKENGLPISKAKLYKLTSKNKIPYRKYGIKLVFSRKALLEWAESKIV